MLFHFSQYYCATFFQRLLFHRWNFPKLSIKSLRVEDRNLLVLIATIAKRTQENNCQMQSYMCDIRGIRITFCTLTCAMAIGIIRTSKRKSSQASTIVGQMVLAEPRLVSDILNACKNEFTKIRVHPRVVSHDNWNNLRWERRLVIGTYSQVPWHLRDMICT